MVDIRFAAAENRRGKKRRRKKEERQKPQLQNIMACPMGGHNYNLDEVFL